MTNTFKRNAAKVVLALILYAVMSLFKTIISFEGVVLLMLCWIYSETSFKKEEND